MSSDGALFCLAQSHLSGFEPTTAITNRALAGSTDQSRRTLTVIGPPIASSTSKATRVPSSIWRWSSGQMLDWWMKQSGPPASHVTKPCPFAESNHRTVPVACGSGGAALCMLVLRMTFTSDDRAAGRSGTSPSERACHCALVRTKRARHERVAGPFVHRNVSARRARVCRAGVYGSARRGASAPHTSQVAQLT